MSSSKYEYVTYVYLLIKSWFVPEICKLFSKKFSIDVAEGGKIKKHSRSEFNFEAVTQKFQVCFVPFYLIL